MIEGGGVKSWSMFANIREKQIEETLYWCMDEKISPCGSHFREGL
jgi:hypothetical protein